ncbi:MAG: UvrD-helicase domain-containing protein [Neisseriales bacterium]|nr:MAG: UvrD-helicase domain-containing protein [Neisseriales bacterium]
MLHKLNESGYISGFAKLLETFLNLFKGSSRTIEDLKHCITSNDINAARAYKFLDIFIDVLDRYESYLAAEHAIDFNDMIGCAANTLNEGTVTRNFKYILIDEFQDISIVRANLIKALLRNSNDTKLVVVGDDWQSIYRFSGSDISVMTKFDEYFGRHELNFLPETFRFNDKIVSVSSRFLLRNSAQITKDIIARKSDCTKSVVL